MWWNNRSKQNDKRKKKDFLDKIIDKSKLFEDQMELLKKVENLDIIMTTILMIKN